MKNSVFVYKKLNFSGKMSGCKPCLLKYERICPIFCLLTIFRTVFAAGSRV